MAIDKQALKVSIIARVPIRHKAVLLEVLEAIREAPEVDGWHLLSDEPAPEYDSVLIYRPDVQADPEVGPVWDLSSYYADRLWWKSFELPDLF